MNFARLLVFLIVAAFPSNAAFVSFQVNSVPVVTCVDSVPSAAAAASFNTCTFSSTFQQAKIDTANAGTATSSTEWWVANPYDNFVVAPGNWDFSGATTVLNKGAGTSDATNSPSISSVYCPFPAATCTSSYRGRTFKNGFLVRYTFAFNEALSDDLHIPFPSFWSVNWLGIASGGEYIELDALDAKPSVGSVLKSAFYHNWNASGQAVDVGTEFSLASTSLVLDGTTFNTVDLLWIPASKNSGTGVFKVYYNGTEVTNYGLTYTQAGMAMPGSGGVTGNYNGAFYNSEVNANGFAIFITGGKLSGGGNWPLKLKNVQIWQGSIADVVVVN